MSKLIFLTINRTLTSQKIFIKNTKSPICSTCLHFIKHVNNYPYDPISDDKQYGRCKKFGEINLITGEIDYDFAKNSRSDNNKCGNFGSEYTEKI